MTDKEYVGDGVYIQSSPDGQDFQLTTENGLEVTNTIFLDRDVVRAVLEYIERRKPE